MTDLPQPQRTALFAGVGLMSAAVLMLELLLTRLFSVALFYHFAFMAVSVAMFGLGLGGLTVYMNREQYAPERLAARVSVLALLFPAAALLVVTVLLRVPVPPEFDAETAVRLTAIFAFAQVPFLFAGALLSLLVWRFAGSIHRIYSYDLLGAALGSLAVLPVLQWIGAPNGVVLAALLACLSAALLSWATGARRAPIWVAGAGAVALASLIALNHDGKILDLRYAKGNPTDQEIYARWNPISRVCVHPSGRTLTIRIDCDAATEISQADFDSGDRNELLRQFSLYDEDLVHVLHPAAKTLVIGAGGGTDVARAIAHGSQRVVAVEINPLIAHDLMLGKMLGVSHGLYERPEVELIVDDARSAIQRSTEKFDVIQATLIDTWASTASGAFALSETYLYTTEAFQIYLLHLHPDGILTVTRWEFVPARQALRVASLARAALERMGAPVPAAHFLVVKKVFGRAAGRVGGKVSVMIKRSPFTAEEIRQARQYVAERPILELLYPPAPGTTNEFSGLLTAPNLEEFARAYPYDVSPVHDGKPFFFFTTRWSKLRTVFSDAYEDVKNNVSLFVLAVLSVLTLLGVMLLLLVPRLFGGRQAARPPVWRWVYFLAIGVAYIVIEIVLMQKFTLFLGHPTFGIAVVVSSLLVGSGLGSRWSARLAEPRNATWRLTLVLAAVLVLMIVFVLSGSVLTALQGYTRAVKVVLSIVALLPLGFVMGMPFPLGVRAANEAQGQGDVLPWLWSANAGGSVFGSVLAMVLAITWGLAWAGTFGAVCYLAASLAAWKLR